MKTLEHSLIKYVTDNYSTTPIRFEGMPHFDTKDNDEWIEPSIVAPTGVSSSKKQEHIRLFIDIRIFSRIDIDSATDDRKDIYRVFELYDLLDALFNKKSFQYLTTGGTQLGTVRLGETARVDLGVDEGLRGIVLTVSGWLIRGV